MKKVSFGSIILIAMIALPMMVACSSDDDSNGGGNDGTAAAYTEEEVKEILKGKWEIMGNLYVTYNSEEYGEDVNDNYEGTIEFFSYSNDKRRYAFRKIFFEFGNYDIIQERNIFDFNYYSLLKKNGKYYLSLSSWNEYYFEIMSLTKTSFKMVLDEDLKEKGKVIGHVRMTLNSK